MNFDKLRFNLTKMCAGMGYLLQHISLKEDSKMKYVAGIGWSKKEKHFILKYNKTLMSNLPQNEQFGVLIHEMYHVIFKHHALKHMLIEQINHKRMNVAGDIVINDMIMDQFIHQLPDELKKSVALPDGAIYSKTFGFEKGLSTLEYYKMLPQDIQDDSFDNHNVDEEGGSPLDIEEMAKATGDLLKKVDEQLNNNTSGVGDIPGVGTIKDIVRTIENTMGKFNAKRELQRVLKQSIPAQSKVNTWMRPHKYYGQLAPGNKRDYQPKVDFYIDTSGSISQEALSKEFLPILNAFLNTLNADSKIYLFADGIYFTGKIKRKNDFNVEWVQSGGTDLTDVMFNIKKRKADLAVILTDGHYNNVDIEKCPTTLFLIQKGGKLDHPLTRLGRTVVCDI